jgi:predicted Zn-dependent peptidase
MTRDDLMKFYRTFYIPNNMVITAVGNFDENRLIAAITDRLGVLPRGDDLRKTPGERPIFDKPVEKTEQRDTAACWYGLAWPSSSLTDSDYYAMEMLNSITGGSMNSRLFVAIREKRGLAYQVSSFTNPRLESGIYVAYIGTKPESYEESKRVLIDEITRMAKEKAHDEEIENARSYLKGMNIMEQESNAGQASKYGHFELLGLGYDFVDRFNEGIDKVDADDIVAAGRKYLLSPYSLGGVLVR